MIVGDDVRPLVLVLAPVPSPGFIQRGKYLRLLREVGVQRDLFADSVLRTREGLAERAVPETGVVEQVHVEVAREGLCVDVPYSRGPGCAVDEDQGWGGGVAERCPPDEVVVGGGSVGECLGEDDGGW